MYSYCAINKNWKFTVHLLVSFISNLHDARSYSPKVTLGTFADETAIVVTHEDPTLAALNLQEHIHIIEKWLKKWKIKVNESRSSHIRFTLQKSHCAAFSINQTVIPQTEAVKYLELNFDYRLKWKEHITRKRKNRLKNKRDQLVDRKNFPSIY